MRLEGSAAKVVVTDSSQRSELDAAASGPHSGAADPGWAYGLFAAVLAPMAAGRASMLHEDRFTPDATWRILADHGVTNFAAAPTAWRALRVAAASPVGLRKASSAGEPLTPEVNEWSTTQLGITVHDHYGQTELAMVFCNRHHPELSAEAWLDGHSPAGMVDGRAPAGHR